MAAEVGKSLLESNTLLEEKYHTLQTEFQAHQQEASKHFQYRLASNEQTITALETQHAELLKKYEATLESKEKISRQNQSCQQKLTAQVNELYQSLERAHEKIQEQQEEGYHRRQEDCRNVSNGKKSCADAAVALSHHVDEYDATAELSTKIEHMMNQHQQLFQAKDQMQHQFQDALVQLHTLKSQLDQAEHTKVQQLNLLENKLQYQENHIQQLTSLIEEYKFDLSAGTLPPSLIFSSSPAHHIEGGIHPSSSEDEEDEFDALPQHIQGATATNLFSELQHAFQKEQQQQQGFYVEPDNHLFPEEAGVVLASPTTKKRYRKRRSTITTSSRRASNQNHQKYNLYPALRIDDSLIAPMAVYRKKSFQCLTAVALQNHMSNISQCITRLPVDAFGMMWRFFRFFIVIQLAMLIHLFTRIKK